MTIERNAARAFTARWAVIPAQQRIFHGFRRNLELLKHKCLDTSGNQQRSDNPNQNVFPPRTLFAVFLFFFPLSNPAGAAGDTAAVGSLVRPLVRHFGGFTHVFDSIGITHHCAAARP